MGGRQAADNPMDFIRTTGTFVPVADSRGPSAYSSKTGDSLGTTLASSHHQGHLSRVTGRDDNANQSMVG